MKTLANLALFQIGWFASVLGAAQGHPFAGPLVVGIAIAIHLRWFGTKREALLILASAAFGTVAESALSLTGLVSYRSDPVPSWLCPPWITAMWANFAMTLRHSLRWLEGRWFLGWLLGAAAGPLAYVAGSRLGAIELLDAIPALSILASVWAGALIALPLLSRKIARSTSR